jgi:adenylylsulfate reductase subunit A
MGILAGAEMTGLEMRFVALRCRGTAAPTGTLAQGVGARQVNARGEAYEERYGLSTSRRVFGLLRETREGRGPCRLLAENLDSRQVEDIYRAYLNMAPLQTLAWAEEDALSGEERRSFVVPVEGTEPYIVGGHTAAGYWVDSARRTTLSGLFAAGDAAGGCPQKYASGAMAEGEIAAAAALAHALENPLRGGLVPEAARRAREEAEAFLGRRFSPFSADHLEEAMQQAMDQDAGGLSAHYSFTAAGLDRAEGRVRELYAMSGTLRAADMRELARIRELRERLVVCRCLLAHLKARRETRWPGFGRYLDYPRKSAVWLRHVNSRLEGDVFRILFRDLVDKEAVYEHHH